MSNATGAGDATISSTACEHDGKAEGTDKHDGKADDSSAMTKAIDEGNITIVKRLIEGGASVNEGNGDDKAPVFAASNKGETAILKLLLDNGGAVNQSEANKNGLTPVCIASYVE